MATKHYLYGGAIELSYDDSKHSYIVDGKKIISVTGVAAPKPGLVYWAAKEASDYVRRNLIPGKALDEIEIAELCEAAKKAHTDKSSKAASIGTLAHQACEQFAKGEEHQPPVNERAKAAYDQFRAWFEAHKVKVHASETKVYHRAYEYAGTLDLDCDVDGERCIVDLKTSNAIYPEYDLQLAAYAKAREYEHLDVKYSKGIILRIPKDGGKFEVREVDDLVPPFSAFIGLLRYYKWAKA